MNQDEENIGSEASDEKASNKEVHPMNALLQKESYELETPKRGEIRTGTIARVTETDVLVDVGAKSEGVILAREIEALPEDERAELRVGKEVSVYVVRSGERDDTLILSLARAEEEQDWQRAEELLEIQELYETSVSGYNKGGLIVKLGHLRGFIPASQVSLARRRRAEGDTPDKRWGKMIGEAIACKVIEVDRRRNRLILSERAAAREARKALKERLIAELKPGEVRTGHVISLADFGAFVDIGGADGLVHVSEISWKRVSKPSDHLSIGQEVHVKVLSVDPERKRISLSLRELEPNPWDAITERYSEGQLVEGTVTKLAKFGAFASLADFDEYEIEGLIHISELSDRHIVHPREIVQEGETYTLRIIKIDRDNRRIGLSLKRVDSPEYAEQDWEAAMAELAGGEAGEQGAEVVEDFDAALEAEGGPDLEPTEEPAAEAEPVSQAGGETENVQEPVSDVVAETPEEPPSEEAEADASDGNAKSIPSEAAPEGPETQEK